jgi:hypothetical protein
LRVTAELRDEAGLTLAVERPAHPFLEAVDITPDRKPEGVAIRVGVAELRKRNSKLGGPAQRIHRGGRVPHPVPGVVFVLIVGDGVVALDARGVDRELVAGAAIVIGVDHDLDLVAGGANVPARQQLEDLLRLGVEHPDEDVEVPLVIGDLRFGTEAGGPSFDRIELQEIGDGGRVPPHFVVGSAIDDHGLNRSVGFGGGCRCHADGGAVGTLDLLGLDQQQYGKCAQHARLGNSGTAIRYPKYGNRCVESFS